MSVTTAYKGVENNRMGRTETYAEAFQNKSHRENVKLVFS